MGRITTKECKSVEGENLKLTIQSSSDDAMVVELQNSSYNSEKWGKIKSFVMLLMFIGLSSSMSFTNVYILAIAVFLLMVNLFLIVQLVEKETVSIVRDFSVQKRTTRAFGRSQTRTITRSQIKSLVVNEVFDNQRVIFLLQLILNPSPTTSSTKEDKQQLVAPLFENLKPNKECVQTVYKIMKSKLKL